MIEIEENRRTVRIRQDLEIKLFSLMKSMLNVMINKFKVRFKIEYNSKDSNFLYVLIMEETI